MADQQATGDIADDDLYTVADFRAALEKQQATIATLTRRVEELEEENAWRPIETAPPYSDGSILVVGGRHKEVEKVPADGAWWRMRRGHLSAIPTHWRPLPTPPKGEDNG